MITLYDFPLSGNCHKVRLLLSCLGLSFERVHVDLLAGEQHRPGFTALNPLGQVPVLRDGPVVIRDSQAILVYLASRYGETWLPREAEGAARVQEWLIFAVQDVATTLQPARLFYRTGEATDIEAVTRRGLAVLGILDARLDGRDWLACDRPSIADLACFPYVGLAREGRLPLDDFHNVTAWIERVARLPGYVPMEGLPGGPAAGSAHAPA